MKKILVVILTTSDSKRDIIDGYLLQAPGYVKKPVDMEWLRGIVQGKIAPVVMLTGFGSENIAVQSVHNGVIDYIPKDHHTKDRLWGTIRIKQHWRHGNECRQRMRRRS